MTDSDLVRLTAPVLCLHCKNAMLALRAEADIGVGIQTYIYGYECIQDGEQVGVCFSCGVPEDSRGHWFWCQTVYGV